MAIVESIYIISDSRDSDLNEDEDDFCYFLYDYIWLRFGEMPTPPNPFPILHHKHLY